MYRFIVTFDVPSSSIEDAYKNLERELRQVRLGWETTDEAYDSEGEVIDPDELNKAICCALKEISGLD